LSREEAYTPAPGRLAAAMATISDRRRPIEDRVDLSNELKCISQIPSTRTEMAGGLNRFTKEK